MNPLKRLIVGTPMEGPARRLLRALRGSGPSWEVRAQRDDAGIDRFLRAALAHDSNCVDIGAHEGVFLDRFLELAPRGRHFAFEPLPRFSAGLVRKYPQVEVFPCALGNHPGHVAFCDVVNLPGWSGLKRQPYPVDARVQTIEVEVRRLDDTLPPEVPIAFIKIDVEGAELDVLKGAAATIRRHRPAILFEHARVHNLAYGTTPGMVYDFLVAGNGLGIYCLDGERPLAKNEFEGIYHSSYRSNYDKNAQTNFLARPR